MTRLLSPEWLDELPVTDGRAMDSRHDLRRLNALMRHPGFVAQELLECFPLEPPRSIAELGAGDGWFMLQVAARLAPRWRGVRVILIDRAPAAGASLGAAFARFGWPVEIVCGDVFDWIGDAAADAVIANLFLHHLGTARLQALFAQLPSRCRAFVACEPRRARLPFWASRLLGLMGCNAVTRHDAPISVRAGFRREELASLWPDRSWRLREREAGLFSHLYSARRML